jgi:hypothetical protein
VQPLKNFPAFYGTRSFITVFTRALHWSLSRARSNQYIPSHPISLRSILVLSTHLRLGLPSDLLPSGFSTNILYAFILSPIRATCPAHLILDLIMKKLRAAFLLLFFLVKKYVIFSCVFKKWLPIYTWNRARVEYITLAYLNQTLGRQNLRAYCALPYIPQAHTHTHTHTHTHASYMWISLLSLQFPGVQVPVL